VETEGAETLSASTIPDEYDPLYAEALFRCHTFTSRLADLMQDGLIDVNLQTFQKLLQKILSAASIPFSGEPVRGMQIMGLLETRNLDFRNVLMLSVNEGMLPKGANDTSFIPYNLRKGFGLTTPEHKDSIFAYYFFRLLQRAENISLVYNTATEGLNRGEMSRFMLQLLIESSHEVTRLNLNSGIELTTTRSITIEKTPDILQRLKDMYDLKTNANAKQLSPTALNSLLDCSLRFYFRYMAGLKEEDQVTEEIDGAVLGNFFHHSAEYIYTHILLRKAGRTYDTPSIEAATEGDLLHLALDNRELSGLIQPEDIEPWLTGIYSIENVVDHFFRKDFFKVTDPKHVPEYNGEQLIKRKLVTGFLKTLLRTDQSNAPFEMIALEKKVTEEIEVETPSGAIKLNLGGIIDRMDRKDGLLRVLDYKTGGKALEPKTAEELFVYNGKRANYIFQTFLYAIIVQNQKPETDVVPQILYINRAAKEDYSPVINIGFKQTKTPVTSIRPFQEEFRHRLLLLFDQLFDPKTPFSQTKIAERCLYCDYKAVCRRNETE